MSRVVEILKINGIKKCDFAKRIYLTRPTLDLYIDKYEKGETLPKPFYDKIFHDLFDTDKSTEKLQQLIDNIPARKVKIVRYSVQLKNNIDYYDFKQRIAAIRDELNYLEQSLDIIYTKEKNYE